MWHKSTFTEEPKRTEILKKPEISQKTTATQRR